jgi:hypothetical protein
MEHFEDRVFAQARCGLLVNPGPTLGLSFRLRAFLQLLRTLAYNSPNWCPLSDSNRPPTDYKSVALPDELKGLILAPRAGLEPATNGLTVRYSTD